MGPAETREKILKILSRVGFPTDRKHEGMEHLPGHAAEGALARALLTSPVLLLLDEPTTGPTRGPLEAGVHPQCGGRTTRPSSSARTICRKRAPVDRTHLDRGSDSPPGGRAGSSTGPHAEDAFFSATGRSFEQEDEDAERGVFA